MSKEILADVIRLREARESADSLWPARVNKINAIRAWIDYNRSLVAVLPNHEETLGNLKSKIEAVESDALSNLPQGASILALRQSINTLQLDLDNSKDGQVAKSLQQTIIDSKKSLAVLENQFIVPDLSKNVLQWRYEVMAGLVQDLHDFSDPQSGVYAKMKERLLQAQTIATKTVDNHKDVWQNTIAEIKNSPMYDGLTIAPQVGLVPLGADPKSQLNEFLHLETHAGVIPVRSVQGEIPMTEDTGIILVLIPKGKFWMGTQKDDEKGQNYDPLGEPEETLREVTIDRAFLLSKYEMTTGQWSRGPAKIQSPSAFPFPRLNYPVQNVSWHMVDTFLDRVGLQMPSQEEWEYAARAKTSSPWACGVTKIKDIPEVGNIPGREASYERSAETTIEDSHQLIAPVGRFRANKFGLFDVLGNVFEWTASTGFHGSRIYRGGSYQLGASYARIAFCSATGPGDRRRDIGVRPSYQLPSN
ncbi:MAG: sulfatase activating formylglycine-generating enzyme [Planctomycetota bacterium]